MNEKKMLTVHDGVGKPSILFKELGEALVVCLVRICSSIVVEVHGLHIA